MNDGVKLNTSSFDGGNGQENTVDSVPKENKPNNLMIFILFVAFLISLALGATLMGIGVFPPLNQNNEQVQDPKLIISGAVFLALAAFFGVIFCVKTA